MIGYSAAEATRIPPREGDGGGPTLELSRHRIDHLLRVCIDRLKSEPLQLPVLEKIIPSHSLQGEFNLSREGKKKQLIDQLVTEAVVLLTAHVSKKNAHEVSKETIQPNSAESGRRI
jgi:hypothetical protein